MGDDELDIGPEDVLEDPDQAMIDAQLAAADEGAYDDSEYIVQTGQPVEPHWNAVTAYRRGELPWQDEPPTIRFGHIGHGEQAAADLIDRIRELADTASSTRWQRVTILVQYDSDYAKPPSEWITREIDGSVLLDHGPPMSDPEGATVALSTARLDALNDALRDHARHRDDDEISAGVFMRAEQRSALERLRASAVGFADAVNDIARTNAGVDDE